MLNFRGWQGFLAYGCQSFVVVTDPKTVQVMFLQNTKVSVWYGIISRKKTSSSGETLFVSKIFMSPVLSRATYRDHFAWHLPIRLCASGSHTFVNHALVIPWYRKNVLRYIAIFFHCIAIYCNVLLCPRHKMARGHLVFALSVLPSFRPSVIPSFRPIKVCLLNSSYILAWIWMKLGRDVAPQVYKCMWGDNSCSTNFGRVMVLDT